MKKRLLGAALFTIIAAAGYSQNKEIRLNAYGAYVFDDGVDSYYSNTNYFSGTIKGGFLWGAGLEYRLSQYYGLELIYQRLDTHAPVEYYDYNANPPHVKNTNFDLAINYIMVGGARSMNANPKVEPYGGFMLGMAILDAKDPDKGDSHNATKFAAGMRLGGNFWLSEKVGLKLQGQLITIPQGAGGGLYFGTGGAGAGVSTYSTMWQWTLGGGLAFKLGGQAQKPPAQPQQ